jgi:hypothetical protein
MTDRADVKTIGGFSSQPPWDNLHSMKRIAIVHEESLSEGMPAALHINARTDHNWQRWRDYVADRPEITHIAFEFATGAGRSKRMRRHADHLIPLAGPLQAPAPSRARARTNPAVDGSAFADHRRCSVLRCRPREPGTDKGYRSRSNPLDFWPHVTCHATVRPRTPTTDRDSDRSARSRRRAAGSQAARAGLPVADQRPTREACRTSAKRLSHRPFGNISRVPASRRV